MLNLLINNPVLPTGLFISEDSLFRCIFFPSLTLFVKVIYPDKPTSSAY